MQAARLMQGAKALLEGASMCSAVRHLVNTDAAGFMARAEVRFTMSMILPSGQMCVSDTVTRLHSPLKEQVLQTLSKAASLQQRVSTLHCNECSFDGAT